MKLVTQCPISLDQLQVARMEVARSVAHTSRQDMLGVSFEQQAAEEKNAESQLERIRESQRARDVRGAFALAGPILGGLVAGGSAVSGILGCARILSPLPLQPLVLLVAGAPTVAMGAAVGAFGLAPISSALGQPLAVVHDNRAIDAGLRADAEEARGQRADERVQAVREEAERARAAERRMRGKIRGDVDTGRETRAVAIANLSSRGGEAATGVAVSRATRAEQADRLETACSEELDANRDRREANDARDAVRETARALHREAAQKEKSRAMVSALIGVGQAVIGVAAQALTGGAATVASLASGGLGLASTVMDDTAARSLDRRAETADAAADVMATEGAEYAHKAEEARALEESIDRCAAANRPEAGAASGQGFGGSARVVSIQRAQLLAALEEERAAKDDARRAQAQQLEASVRAIDARRRADALAAQKHTVDTIFSGVALGASVLGALTQLEPIRAAPAFHDAVDPLHEVVGVAEKVIGPTQGVVDGVLGDRGAPHLRTGEAFDLTKKRFEVVAKDAREAEEVARRDQSRALEVALEAARGRSLQLT